MTDHRAAFDASITFANGGDLTVHDFRVDVPSPHVTDDEIAALFVASLGLLMTDAVELSNVRVFPEPHKGTRGGPSDHTTAPPPRGRIHPLDTPATRSELPRAVSLPAADALRARAEIPETATAAADELAAPHGEVPAGAPGNGPQIKTAAGEGTPASRESQAGEGELAAAHGETPETAVAELGGTAAGTGSETSVTSAEQAGAHEEGQADFVRTVELPAVVVRASGAAWEAIGVGALAAFAVRGHAVLLQTQDAETLTEAAARWLVSQDVALVATDAPTLGAPRKILLEAGIPVVESLTGLAALPPTGAFFTAVPPYSHSRSAPARAYARIP
ncbi:MAG TPA: hypothetical protein VKZ82_23905 [Nonomuraea sp.]|nr:hypothetical protein [Nonomuraea sp.]